MKVTMNTELIKKLCLQQEIRISPLLERLGLAPSCWSEWKKGREPRAGTLFALAAFFKVDAMDLITIKE